MPFLSFAHPFCSFSANASFPFSCGPPAASVGFDALYTSTGSDVGTVNRQSKAAVSSAEPISNVATFDFEVPLEIFCAM